VPLHDVREVSRCVDALAHGVQRLEELPLSLRLVRELHARLVADGRGGNQAPGEFRRSQNWIGGSRPGNARHVPPPPDKLPECLAALEQFANTDPPPYPPLVMAALLHVQFETIHPFLDGNGRVGRILITLYLLASGALRSPLLYLSLYFKEHRPEYYDLLTRVRTAGAWEDWVRFFLRGVQATAQDAQRTIQRMQQQLDEDRAALTALGKLGRSTQSALRLHAALAHQPIATSAELARRSGMPVSSVVRNAQRLIELGLLRELTGRQRGRIYSYHAYLAILNEGTDPLAR
jgi:Fic family protein